MPMAAARGKRRSISGKASSPEPPARAEFDRIAAALREIYGRIAAEPLPQRLVELLNRLKCRD